MALSIEQFGKEMLTIGLSKADELKRIWGSLLPSERPRTVEVFAQLLVRREKLTEYQAAQILAGRAATLVFGDFLLVAPLDDEAEPAKFIAKNRGSGRLYVIERLPVVGDTNVAERIAQRVRGVVKLVHPNLARVFEAGVIRGQSFLTREWIEGRSLATIVAEQGALAPIEAVDYLAKAARGLAELHTARIAQGNLKPTKIVVDSAGVVKLLGLDVRSPAAQAAAVAGEFDPTDDLKALAELTYYLLTGDAAERTGRKSRLTVDSLKAKRANVPAEIDRIFRKLIEPGATPPYANAGQLVADLDAWRFPKKIAEPVLGDLRAGAESVLQKEMVAPTPEEPPPRVDRNNMLLLFGAAINLALLGVLYLIFWRSDDTAKPPEETERKFSTMDELAAAHATGTSGGAKGATTTTTTAAIVDQRPKPRSLSAEEEQRLASGPARLVVPFDATAARAAQQAWAEHLGEAIETSHSLGLKFALIPPGECQVGTPSEERKELLLSGRLPAWVSLQEPQYAVVLSRPYRLSTTEVTVGQFRKFAEATGYRTDAEKVEGRNYLAPGYVATDDYPATCISWDDAAAFCAWLTKPATPSDDATSAAPQREIYRLPTEAEWEFACRAGTATPYACGDESRLQEFGWTKENSFAHAQPVARKRPNHFGLYDLHGNAAEWCADWYADNPLPNDPLDPRGPISGGKRVVRGGSWDQMRLLARSAFREGVAAAEPPTNHHGFRIVREW